MNKIVVSFFQKTLLALVFSLSFFASTATETRAEVDFDDYPHTMASKLHQLWTKRSDSGNAFVFVRFSPDGKIAEFKITQAPNKDAEAVIKSIFQRAQPFGPLPANLQSTPCATIEFCWAQGGVLPGTVSVGGPYFDKREIAFYACRELRAQSVPGKGKVKVYLKVNKDGSIAKIFTVSKTKDATAEKAAYNVMAKAQPFAGTVDLAAGPYHEIDLSWSWGQSPKAPYQNTSATGKPITQPPAWLK